MATKMNDEFIEVDEVETLPRGRKPNLDSNLVNLLKQVPEGKAVRLGGTFGQVPKENRPSVSAVIRKHWAAAHPGTKARIDFTRDGVPQVRSR
jgi:hypothetical protein